MATERRGIAGAEMITNSRGRKMVLVICKQCGKEFRALDSDVRRGKCIYCSRECYGKSISGSNNYQYKEHIEKYCDICGRLFYVFPSEQNRARFCSVECRIEGKKKFTDRKCPVCGRPVKFNRVFCSMRCFNVKRSMNKQQRTDNLMHCKVCGKAFRTATIQNKQTYCSLSCYGKDTVKNMGERKHRGLGGKRDDLNGQYFRSSWEANYARYLNWLISIGEIISWEFEPETFEFTTIKKGNRFYTPDFKITNKDGSVEYHEVKGYMDDSSATKIKRFNRFYPDKKLIIIDRESYRELYKQVRNLIPNWEDNKGHGY